MDNSFLKTGVHQLIVAKRPDGFTENVRPDGIEINPPS
jgi:hypothetical protein